MKIAKRDLQDLIKESVLKPGNFEIRTVDKNYNFPVEKYKSLATDAFNHYKEKGLLSTVDEVARRLNIGEDILLGVLIDEYVRMYPRAYFDFMTYFNWDQSVGISQVKPETVRGLSRYLPPKYNDLKSKIETMSTHELAQKIQEDDELAIYFAGAVIRHNMNNWESAFNWMASNKNAIKTKDIPVTDKRAILGTLYSYYVEPRAPVEGEDFVYPKSNKRGMNIMRTADRYRAYKDSELPPEERIFEGKIKLTNRKIKKLIRESLQRILFESEERIQQLKDQEALLFSKRIAAINAGDNRSAQKLTQELENIKSEYESLEKNKAKPVKEREPSEFDEMFVDINQPVVPHKQKSSRRGLFSSLFGGEDTTGLAGPEEMATFDVTPGSSDLEFQDIASQPMTAKEKQQAINRRGFLQGLGASAMLGKQILDSDSLFSDPRLQIASDWFDQSFADGTWSSMYDASTRAVISNSRQNIGKDFDSMSTDEQLSYIIDYIMDYGNEEWYAALDKVFRNAGYENPYETNEVKVNDQLDDLIYQKLSNHYTPDKIKQLRSTGKDPRLKIASDWFDRSFTDGTWHSMYDHNFKTWTDNALINVDKDFNSMSPDEKLEYIRTYLMDYNPEGWSEALITEFERLGHRDPGETGEMDVYNQLDELVKQKIKNHYTPEKIKQLRSGVSSSTSIYEDPHSITAAKFAQLNDDQLARYVSAYVDMEMEYTHKGRLESADSFHVIGDITDEITDSMVHQILEDENAGRNPMYEKLYDSLVGLVEDSVLRHSEAHAQKIMSRGP